MKVLQISMGETFGGVERLELDLLNNINKDIRFDFLTPNDIPFIDYKNEIEKLNGGIYNLNVSRNNRIGKLVYAHRLYKFLKNNKYDIVHINSSAFFFSFHLALITRICKNGKVVVHIHSLPKIGKVKKIMKKLLFPIYFKITDEYLACSKKSGEAFFTKKHMNKVQILKNGIEIEKFKFNESTRKEYIEKLGLEGNVVYGNIGRFELEKNHMLLIDIFNEIQKRQENSKLLLVGEGKLKQKIEEKVKQLGIEEKVIFLGFRKDIDKILNCLDVFILPSISEGLGISAIEAQTNGVYVYCSKAIPNEAKISSNLEYFDLKELPFNIANTICNKGINLTDRKEAYNCAIENGYDIKETCKKLEEIYARIKSN